MKFLYSQALVADYLVHDSSAGKPSAELSKTPTAKLYLSNDKMKVGSILSRSGMTSAHMTEHDGKALLTWYLSDFHVKTSQQQTKTQKESQENDQDYGEREQELFGKYDPSTHSLKTLPCSSAVDSMLSLATLPKWGSMRTGELFQPKMSVQITCEKDAGLLPETKTTKETWATPTAYEDRTSVEQFQERRKKQGKTPNPNNLSVQVRMREQFPTPRAKEPGRTTKGYGRGLAELVEGKEQVNKKETFPTPIAQDANKLPSNGLARLVQTGKRYSDGHFKNKK